MILHQNSTILITGAAGFIASCMASFLNQQGYHHLILVDDFSREDKKVNYQNLRYEKLINRNDIVDFFATNPKLDFIIHFGAKTDTTEMDYSIHEKLNLEYSKTIWTYCTLHKVPLIYASSAATYGDGELGYDDNHEAIFQLEPLNPYGVSKNEFDKWAIQQNEQPPHWYGLKFFNVYGPNEYHKGRMASVIFHAFHQIKKNGSLKLFRSHNPNYSDGGQMRDFIYVKDILSITWWLLNRTANNGIYNAGTGKAETFNALGHAVFHALNLTPNIEYIDTPIDIRDKYQYYTEANMQKLKDAGYTQPFYTLHNGVQDYVQSFLNEMKIY